jgi:alkanesulfonate monooxygenase SsuD/methylene tetrahydromethanopterin reductase-like flavin-dependent oxidoreductase (luciferase family)
MLTRIGAERGWPPPTRESFAADVAHGAQHLGSPETVARKIARTVRAVGAQRFDLKYSGGPIPHEQLMRSIELYGTQVAPRVRELLAEQPATVV